MKDNLLTLHNTQKVFMTDLIGRGQTPWNVQSYFCKVTHNKGTCWISRYIHVFRKKQEALLINSVQIFFNKTFDLTNIFSSQNQIFFSQYLYHGFNIQTSYGFVYFTGYEYILN